MRISRRLVVLLCLVLVGSLVLSLPGRAGQAGPDPQYRFQLNRFTQVFDLIILASAQQVSFRQLIDGAISGMLEVLEDPAAQHFTPEAHQRHIEQMEGVFGGIGISLTMEDGAPVVLQVFPGTPAERAGIMPRDLILEADGRGLIGLGLDAIVTLIRGEAGTAITLRISRPGVDEPFTRQLLREIIRVRSVESRLLEAGVGYLRITGFQAGTAAEARQALQALRDQGIRGLILDLRDNGGGLLDQAVETASLFLPQGPVVRIRGRAGISQFRHGHGAGFDLPLVVLVNGRTASAAEIVAGAIQDYRAGLLVGTRTFGKATVQSIFQLLDGGALKLTTANYFTPIGRAIHGQGLQPDEVVPEAERAGLLPEAAILLQYRRTLTRGIVGLDVLSLQERLNQLGLAGGEEDGVLGEATERAVREFQRSAGLPVTGAVDAATVDALNRARMPHPEPAVVRDTQLERGVAIIRGQLR
ncbi:MAG TPA: S41 family peptidase [Clostridiales bacterium]|nr:S41 family peptidase [Clostridiales bacterium]